MNVKTAIVITVVALALAACSTGPKGVRITNNGSSATSDKPGEKIRTLTADEIRTRIAGKTFQYMSCNTVLLSLIIERTSGLSISDYASQKLWKKINATQPAYWSLDHFEGLEKSYCCFYSSARDFAKIGKLYMDSGRWNGRQLVPVNYVKQSLTPNGCIDENGKTVDFYGYHWWLMKLEGHSIFYARGIYGQYIIAIPDERIIIVRLGKKRGEKTDGNHYTDMIEYTKEVLKTFSSTN